MPRWAVCAMGAALVLCLASKSGATEPDDDVPAAAKTSGNWFTRWFGSGKQASTKKDRDKEASVEAAAAHQKAQRTVAAAERAREEADLLRRQGICLKLRTIAAQTNNEELRRQADQLDEQAWNLYLQRTANLPGGSGEALDEALLQRHLGNGAGREDAAATSTSRSMGSQTAARGERP